MRKTLDLQMEFFKKDIADIIFDLTCRDEIPKVLLGLQYIYATSSIRKKVFNELSSIIPKKSQETGRPGMDLWKILVLGTLRLNCNWDFDKVHEMANNHHKIRQMLGHDEMDFESNYALQTIRDNVVLLTPQTLDKINQIVVKAGHDLINPSKLPALKGSCDSFVVETDVHFPTDSNLLFDAMRKMISSIALICWEIGLSDWRQSQHNIRTIKKQLRVIQRLRHSTSKNETKKEERAALIVAEHQKYIQTCQGFIFKTKETIGKLRQSKALSFTHDLRLMGIETYIQHADRQIDQIYRRIALDETIPHAEKIFSIFEPHTEWISKGKAGVPQELGLRVCILKDQHGFILNHRVMEHETDDKVAIPMVTEAKEKFEALASCSFDKGFHTPQNRKALAGILDAVILPKKGRLSEKDKQIEHSEDFIKSRRKHSAVESSINALENHGLDRCRDHGLHGFKRYVALSVLARNIQILGNLIQLKEVKRQKRKKAA